MISIARVTCLFSKFSKIFSSNLWHECLCILLLTYDRLTGVYQVELSGIMSVNHLHQQYKASSHFDHTPLLPSFYALVQSSNNYMVRIWLICGFWKLDEVVPIVLFIIKSLGVTSTFAYIVCYARRRGLGEWIHDRCEIVNLMVHLRWQL